MDFRKGYKIYTIIITIFSLAVIVIWKYFFGSGLYISVLLSLLSIILFISSFYFLIPTHHWNSLIKERAMIEYFMEENNDYKKLEMISRQEDLDRLSCYVKDKLMLNHIVINDKEIIESIENEDIGKLIDNDKINNKHKKLLKKSIRNYKNSASAFTIIKMKYKSGFYSKDLNYTLFYTLLSISISIFALSSFEAFKLYDQFDITFSILFFILSIISIVYDSFIGKDKIRKSLNDTYDYLNSIKNKCKE